MRRTSIAATTARAVACVNPWPLPLTLTGLPADPALPSGSVIVSVNSKLRSLAKIHFRSPVQSFACVMLMTNMAIGL
jgi:hypothetical protein